MSQLISIVVPVYNVEEYLARCLDSILNQTHKDIEIITVDDGSTDSSGNILDEYSMKDSRIKVIHQNNCGVSSARLRGINEASGEWIGFVDADDYIEPDMYETLFKNAVQYNADISHCGHRLIHLDGNVHYFYNTGTIKEQNTTSGLIDLLNGDFVEPTLCTKLIKRTLLTETIANHKIDTTLKYNEDFLLNFLCFSISSQSVYYDFCPYHYYARETSATRNRFNLKKILDPIKVRHYILQTSPNELEPLAQKIYINKVIDAYSILCFTPKHEYIDEKSNVLKIIKENKAIIKLLGFKRRLLATIIVFSPSLYKMIAKLKSKFTENVYY